MIVKSVRKQRDPEVGKNEWKYPRKPYKPTDTRAPSHFDLDEHFPSHLHFMTPPPELPEELNSSPRQAPPDRPERSRNAKAQARHRAKRKAYIEQLEQTVAKLHCALLLSPEQMGIEPLAGAGAPPSVLRIRELQDQNKELGRQIDDLRAQIEDRNVRIRQNMVKRRRMVEGSDSPNLISHVSSARRNNTPLHRATARQYNGPYPQRQHYSPITPAITAVTTQYTGRQHFPDSDTHTSSVVSTPTASLSSASIYLFALLPHHPLEAHYSPQMQDYYILSDHAQHVQRPSRSYQTDLHWGPRATRQVMKVEQDAYPVRSHTDAMLTVSHVETSWSRTDRDERMLHRRTPI
ncbi:hypothetical protein NM688_g598 [Phlebia brevispora]|uniref:Uncharacterized protein n=1 Tax=Phlebia brevispora TaxID=194682 RepID=A0ACC1TDK1_9APHY|nr:hypothetical protein NM688_g598 [Phlebia brevispora]